MDITAQKERLVAGLVLAQSAAEEPLTTSTPMRLRLLLKQLDLLIPAFWHEAPSQVAEILAEQKPALLEALSGFSAQRLGFAIRTQRIVQEDSDPAPPWRS